jgi:hypothetical protein
MSRTALWSLGVTAALSTVALLATPAAAKIAFQWKVGGKALAAGETRAFTSSTDGKILDLHVSLFGAPVLFLSNKATVSSGKIIGGTPGVGEETIKFENVAVDTPKGCTLETGGIANPTPGIIETTLSKIEIVEGETSRQPLILFGPKVGKTWIAVKFLNKGSESCGLAGVEWSLEGNLLAQPLPQLIEALHGDLEFEAPNQTFLLSSGGDAESAGLRLGAESIPFTDLILNVLTTDEIYGAF